MRQEDRTWPLAIVRLVRIESDVFVQREGAFLVGSTPFDNHFRAGPPGESCATMSQRARDLGKAGIQESDIETKGERCKTGMLSLSVGKLLRALNVEIKYYKVVSAESSTKTQDERMVVVVLQI